MTSFLTFIATPAIGQVNEKSIFGKSYVRIGRLFGTIGSFVYQEGGVLGYTLRDTPALLVKLAAPPGGNKRNVTEILESFKRVSEKVASDLEEVRNQEKDFFYLFTVRELHTIGIELIKYPPDKSLEKKASAEFAGEVMRISFVKGIAFGFHFPEQFSLYWDNTYKMRADSEWQEMRNLGIILSEKQQRRTLKEAITEVAEAAILWSANENPNTLDATDIATLEAIIKANREK